MDVRKLLITAAIAATLPTAAMASVVHRDPGAKPVAEQSQAQVAKQQGLQGTTAEVGLVPRDTDGVTGGPISDQSGAAAVVAGRQSELSIKSDPLAEAVVVAASSDLKTPESTPVAKVGWGIGFLLLGLGVVAGLRQWTAREVSDLPVAPRSVKW